MNKTSSEAKREGQRFSDIRGSAPWRRNPYMVDLAAVTSVREAAKLWHMSPSTVLRLCNEGRITAVQPGGSGAWFISVQHMRDRFGEPDVKTLDQIHLTL